MLRSLDEGVIMKSPPSLIINSPFVSPEQHWVEDKAGGLTIKAERRPAGYEIFDVRNNTRRTEELTLVNTIRHRVEKWREAGYPGITSVTRRLLEYWSDASARQYPFYFCQLEAIETLIWWTEGAEECNIPKSGAGSMMAAGVRQSDSWAA